MEKIPRTGSGNPGATSQYQVGHDPFAWLVVCLLVFIKLTCFNRLKV